MFGFRGGDSFWTLGEGHSPPPPPNVWISAFFSFRRAANENPRYNVWRVIIFFDDRETESFLSLLTGDGEFCFLFIVEIVIFCRRKLEKMSERL